MMEIDVKEILVLGSTGYVGSRLVPGLINQGYIVRAGWRTRSRLEAQPWKDHPNVKPVQVDVFNTFELREAISGVDVVYYLIHSMYSGKDFKEKDRIAASNTASISEKLNVKRIIYLSGLGEEDDKLSKHLRSRKEVDKILRLGKTPVTSFQAAMIIGPGSASFEIMRYLVDRLPVMITPKWVRTKTQPISIEDTIMYLVRCLEKSETIGETYDMGGPQVTTYHDLMRAYAKEAGLKKRIVFPIPILTPWLSSYWVHLITPIQASIARPLIEGLSQETICSENRIREIIPQKLLTIRESIHLTLSYIEYSKEREQRK
jgi:uncharacterized protein YbjT (DUF2867 family)